MYITTRKRTLKDPSHEEPNNTSAGRALERLQATNNVTSTAAITAAIYMPCIFNRQSHDLFRIKTVNMADNSKERASYLQNTGMQSFVYKTF